MYLELGLKIVYDEQVKRLYIQDYRSNISSDGYQFAFHLRDFDKTAYALKVLNEECISAIKRADERLLADEFGKQIDSSPRWETYPDKVKPEKPES